MGTVVKPNTFSPGETIESAKVNDNFDTLYTLVNGNLEAENISGLSNTGAVDLDNVPDGSTRTAITSGENLEHNWTVVITRTVSTLAALSGIVSGDSFSRMVLYLTYLGFGPGSSTRDTRIIRSGTKTLDIDDAAGGDLTGLNINAVDTNFSGLIKLVTGKSIYQPDVAGGSANDGKFVGGNGGFMWFDGTTNGATEVTLDSTLDWRDRWIVVILHWNNATSYSTGYPGGAQDNYLSGTVSGYTGDEVISGAGFTKFYSETGSSGPTVWPAGNVFYEGATNYISVYAKSTNGNLVLARNSASGSEMNFGLSVWFSNDQGHV